MHEILLMKNPVQEYEWGSRTAIAELLGEPSPSAKPQAELWMGAHPRAPSSVRISGRWERLPDVISRTPDEVLGPRVAARFGATFPFLFKVLAAGKPLSLQAHPSLDQAKEGFQREERAGVPLSSPERSYRDPNHKPETICALTEFTGLCGFRRIPDMVARLRKLGPGVLDAEVDELRARPDTPGLKRFFTAMMTLGPERRAHVVGQAVRAAERQRRDDPAFEWIVRLNSEYPGDVGVLSPAILNLVHMTPGQAMFLPAGELHAYLEGVGIELMANSDNVLRGGLTPKHVDVPELLRVLTFREHPPEILATEVSGAETRYPSMAAEFRLTAIRVAPGADWQAPADRSVELLICVEGRVTLAPAWTAAPLELGRGMSALVPAALPGYAVRGEGLLYRASVP